MQDLKLSQPPRNHSLSKLEHMPGWSDGLGPIGATSQKLLICLAALLRRCPSCIARGGITHKLQLVFDNSYVPVWPGGMRRALYMYILIAHDYICIHINNHIHGHHHHLRLLSHSDTRIQLIVATMILKTKPLVARKKPYKPYSCSANTEINMKIDRTHCKIR